jgi:hypothetical protein
MTLFLITLTALCLWRMNAHRTGSYGIRPEPQAIRIASPDPRNSRRQHAINAERR